MATGGGNMSKKKQEEETLKNLRLIASVQSNKQCFDCGQKGPTYLNMTIGAFVCTACSGLLRGLNPPQRIKSVSMASFTPDEVEFVKSRGNDFCRKVWLGQSTEAPPQYMPGSRDEIKIRDMMALRYEKKRWYTAPTEALHEEARQLHSTAAAANKPKQQPVGKNNTLLISATTAPQLANRASSTTEPKPASTGSSQSNPVSPTSMFTAPPASQTTTAPVKSFDLLADLGGDPFAQQPQQQQHVENGTANFANFGNFSTASLFSQPPQSTLQNTGFFPSTQPTANSQWSSLGHLNTAPVQQTATGLTTATSAEKYSAIAEIDGVFGQQSAGPLSGSSSFNQQSGGSLSGGGSAFNWNSSTQSHSVFGGTSTSSAAAQPANPFGTTHSGSQQTSVANPFMQQPASGAGSFFGQSGGFMTPGGFSSQPAGYSQPVAPPPSYMQVTSGGFQQQQQAGLGFPQQQGGFPTPSGFNQIPTGGGFGQPAVSSGGFGQPAVNSGSFGQPSVSAGGFGQPAVSAGGFGQPAANAGGFGAQSIGGQFGGMPAMFNNTGAGGSGTYYGANPVQPSANPFMQTAAAPRRTNTSNPFL